MTARMSVLSARVRFIAFGIVLLGLAEVVHGSGAPGLKYSGRVVYRSTKASAGSLLIELVEAKDSGEPTDEVLGNTRADAEGHFTLEQKETTDKPMALVAFAVRETADSGGDRREEGYDIKSHMTRLGVLLNPSATKSNTVLVEYRKASKPKDD